MSNRLEREFPAQRWQAVPPIRRDAPTQEVVARYMARGRELRSAALRRAGRRVVAAVAGVIARPVAVIRRAACASARQPREHHCRGACARGA